MKKWIITCLLTAVYCGASHATTILSEDFEGTFPPEGWTQVSIDQSTTYALSGSYSARFTSTSDELITPPLTNAQTVTFWSYATTATPVVNVESSTSVSGPWTAVTGSPFTNTGGQWTEQSVILASSEILYLRFTKSNSGYIYIDDVSAEDAPAGNSSPTLDAIGDQSVVVSNDLSFTVSASDINGDDIVLSATNLPAGATFTTVTNAAAVTNTFTWTEAAPTGTYSVTFFADDGTTNVSETITITVSDAPVLPDYVTFGFFADANLYGALDDEPGPITYTNNGLVATFTASEGEMNRTTSGFGINGLLFDESDKFDLGEWIDITFETSVVLSNITVSSWNAGSDEAEISVNGVTNGVISSSGSHAFEIIVPSGQVLQIACTEGVIGNGWSLDSITVRTNTNAPPEPNTPPVFDTIDDQLVIAGSPVSFSVSASDADNDDIILSASNLPAGAVFNTITNAGVVSNTFTWANTEAGVYTPVFYADDGTTNVSGSVTITVIEQPLLMLSEIADPAGTGGGNYRFVELYNAGTNTIDLTNWTLSMQDNGDANDWRDVALTGSIGPTGTYLVAYSATNFLAAYGFEPDLEDGNVVEGNGRDTYALFYGGDHSTGLLIDIYGEIDVDGDGTAWDYENDRAERNNPILEPNPVWTAAEWTISVNTYTNEFTPGIHGPTPEFSPIPEDQIVLLGDDLSLVVTAVNTVRTDVITLSATDLPGEAIFPTETGTNTVSSTLSWIAPTAGTYTVTFAADGDVDTTYASIEVLVVDLEADTDGDGMTNGDELIAGTDIYSAYSYFHISDTEIDTNGFYTLNWYAVSGHDYGIWWTESLTNEFQLLTTVSAPTNSWTDTDAERAADIEGFYKLEVGPTP